MEWQTIDEEKLRETIDKVSGETRNVDIVQKASHKDKKNSVLGFYNASKESKKTLVVIERFREKIKTGHQSKEITYFISNQDFSQNTVRDLFDAARKHWSIESDNYVRDNTFGEDQIICFNTNTFKTTAECISWFLNLLIRQ